MARHELASEGYCSHLDTDHRFAHWLLMRSEGAPGTGIRRFTND